MTTHSSVLAWRIPGTGEPGGLPSMGSHRVGHDWSDLAAAAAFHYCFNLHISTDIWYINRLSFHKIIYDLYICFYSFFFFSNNQFWLLLVVPLLFLFSIFSSVQFSRLVVSDSLQPHGLQHARPPCSSPTPTNSCPLSWWCHLTISSSVIPFSSHLQSFPASRSFQMSWYFTSGGQSIEVSASTSVLTTLRTDL